jgi:hypothetical protein
VVFGRSHRCGTERLLGTLGTRHGTSEGALQSSEVPLPASGATTEPIFVGERTLRDWEA